MAVVFEYRAYDAAGQLVTGTIEALSVDEAAMRLREQGYFPSAVTVAKRRKRTRQRAKRLSSQEVAVFARQMAIMLQTGMPVVTCLDVLAGQQPHPVVRQAVLEVRRDVGGGQGLAESMRRHPHVFPQLFVDMVEVGETTGHLVEILERMSRFYENDAKIRGEIKQATMYPKVVVAFSAVAVAVVLFVVLPAFADMFRQLGAELPLVTRMVVAVRDFVAANLLWVLLALAAAAASVRRFLQTDRGRRLRDQVTLKLPIIGGLASRVVFSRFARTLALLFASGVSMVESLSSCEQVVGNVVVAADIAKARAGVQRGEGLAAPLRREAKAFPPMLVEMIAVGEETGSLDKVLEQVADFYDREVEQTLKGLTSVIEPLIMVVLGGVIFLIVLSVFMPMFDLANAIQ